MLEQNPIEIGFQVYAKEGGETFGAVPWWGRRTATRGSLTSRTPGTSRRLPRPGRGA